MLAPYPTRLRSYSSPVHPKRSTPVAEVSPAPVQRSAFAAVEEAPELHGNNSEPQSSPHAASHNTRKVFRLKRPSSSSSAMDAAFSTDLRAPPLRSKTSSSPQVQSRPPPPAVPLRRVGSRSGSRPLTSSDPLPPERTRTRVRSASTSTAGPSRDSSFFRGFGPIMGVRAGPR